MIDINIEIDTQQFEKGEMLESQTMESFEQFENTFGKYEPSFIGVPVDKQSSFLSYLRSKVSIPLSKISERIQLRHEIQDTIEIFLDENTKFSKKEYDGVVAYLTRVIKKYIE